jgi:hypothetical protein
MRVPLAIVSFQSLRLIAQVVVEPPWAGITGLGDDFCGQSRALSGTASGSTRKNIHSADSSFPNLIC